MKSGLRILFCILALAANLKAQDFFPSAKAVGLSFTHIPDEGLKNVNADLQLDQWAVSAPAFYLPSDNWALGGGLSYEYSLLDYTNSSVINERELHSLSVPIVVTLDSTENLKWIGMINPNISGKYLVNEDAKALELPKEILAPRKSTLSLNSSFVILFVPLPNKLPIIEPKPAFSPSNTGSLAIVSEAEALGNL